MAEEAEGPIRVLIAEDHAVVREGLRIILDMEDDVKVVGEASGGAEAVALAQQLKPHVVLMDIRMEDMDGVEATRNIRREVPETNVLVLTGFAEDRYLLDAIEAGANGFLVKDARPEKVIEAIHLVASGESLVTPALLRKLLDAFARRREAAKEAHDALTPREMEVLTALAGGMKNEEIAQELVISEKTVKSHLTSVFSKLKVDGRTQAMLYAIREGLVDI